LTIENWFLKFNVGAGLRALHQHGTGRARLSEAFMSYCLKTDLQKEISDAELVGLTDDEGTGVMDDAIINWAIAKMDALIDSIIGVVVEVPLTTVPAIIVYHSTTGAIYFLYSRRSVAPELRRKNFEDTIQNLRDIASGRASLPPVEAGEVTEQIKINLADEDKIFTRDKMKGF
jgi:phage gp36-like protein